MVGNVLEHGPAGRALVIGDAMLDVFTEGEASRLSPEAPVPVVLQSTRRVAAGGAGNAAVNLSTLGDRATLIATVGSDTEAAQLISALELANVDVSGLVAHPGPTTSKHRVLAGGQQLVRLDVESPVPMRDEIMQATLNACRLYLDHADVVLISDYDKGVCTPELCQEVIRMARVRGLPVVVDPKGSDFTRYRGATLITPNLDELAKATPDVTGGVDERAKALRDSLGCSVLVTRSAEGMSLFRADGGLVLHLPTEARAVFDVTGAGDTVASVIAAMLGRGIGLEQSCRLANACAGIVVGRTGTSPIQRDELLTLWDGMQSSSYVSQ